MTPRAAQATGPVERTMLILEAFADQRTWGVRELAAHLQLTKSGVHRALGELTSAGVLTAEADGTYAAGPALVRIAARIVSSTDFVTTSMPHLLAARDRTGETVILTVYDPVRRKFAAVAAVESQSPIRYIWQSLQDWSDLHLGSSGRSILAFLPNDVRRDVVAHAPFGRRDLTALEQDLDDTRVRGYAASVGSRFPGARGVGAPVLDANAQVVGAVVIGWADRAGPEEAARQAERGEVCCEAARKISADLGWRADEPATAAT